MFFMKKSTVLLIKAPELFFHISALVVYCMGLRVSRKSGLSVFPKPVSCSGNTLWLHLMALPGLWFKQQLRGNFPTGNFCFSHLCLGLTGKIQQTSYKLCFIIYESLPHRIHFFPLCASTQFELHTVQKKGRDRISYDRRNALQLFREGQFPLRFPQLCLKSN